MKFIQPIAEKFISLREKQLFCDLTFKLANNSEVKCHSHVLAAHCKLLSNNKASFIDVPDFDELTLDLFSEVMNVLYGKGSLVINKSNYQLLQQLGQFLECEKLNAICSQVATFEEGDETKDFKVSPQDILTALRGRTCDCTITYRGVSIEMHRFLLAALFDYFVEKWTLDCPDRDDHHLNFSDKFQFSNIEFMSFFDSLYEEVIPIGESNFYTLIHLCRYFKYPQLIRQMISFCTIVPTIKSWIPGALVLANNHDDSEFIELVSPCLNNTIIATPLTEPIPFKPHMLKALCSYIQEKKLVIWVVDTLIHCYKTHTLSRKDFIQCVTSLHLTPSSVNTVYNMLAEFLNDEQLGDSLTPFLCETVLPLLSKFASSTEDSHQVLVKKFDELELQVHRQRIVTFYQQLGSRVRFYGDYLKWEDNDLYYTKIFSDFSIRAWIVHPLDGEVVLQLLNIAPGTQIGFYDIQTKTLYGFSFHDRMQVQFNGSVVGYCYSDCQVLLSFKFSKSQTVAFKLLSPLIECKAEVPPHLGLCLNLCPYGRNGKARLI
ncbi:hypothetical protein RCL1_006055 [Eukaryota sp. TZLM3-RCL]